MVYPIFNTESRVYADYLKVKLLERGSLEFFALTLIVTAIGGVSAIFPFLGHLMFQGNSIESTRLMVQLWVSLLPWFVIQLTWVVDQLIGLSILIGGAVVMAFVPDFWAVTVNAIHAVRYGLSFQWFYHGPFLWFDSHVMLTIHDGPIANSFVDSGLAILLMTPILGFIALPYDPLGTFHMMSIFIFVSVTLIPVGFVMQLLRTWEVQRLWRKSGKLIRNDGRRHVLGTIGRGA